MRREMLDASTRAHRTRRAALGIALACLLGPLGARPALADCPYAPDPGLFITDRTTTFNLVPVNPATVGAYAIRFDNGTVRVTRSGAEVAAVDVRHGMNARYLFYPATGAGANRFLFIDRHTVGFGAITFTFEPVLVDLSKWTSGAAPLAGRELFSQSYPATLAPFLHVSPSPGNGLSVFTWLGTNDPGGRVKDATLHRSDTGEAFVWASPFDASVTVAAEITATTARIKDGARILAESPLPVCSAPPPGDGGGGGGGGAMLPTLPPVSSTNGPSVLNPGFENSMTPWSAYSPQGALFSATRVSLPRRNGLGSLAESGAFGIVYQDVAGLVPGRVYVVSAWFSSDAGATARGELSVHDTQGDGFRQTQAVPGTAWRQVRVLYVANQTGRVRVHLVRLDGVGAVYWDDVSISAAPLNGGFEIGALMSWAVYSPEAGFAAATSTAIRHGGSRSLAESSVFGIVYQDVDGLTPGHTYVISAWVAASTGATAAAELSVHNTQGARFAATQAVAGTTWQVIQLAYTADATGRVRVHLVRLHGTGTIYWDDVTLAEAPSPPTSLRLP